MKQEVIDKFLKHANKTTGCWIWSGDISTKRGTPVIRIYCGVTTDHRTMMEEYSPRQISLLLANKPPSKFSKTSCGNKLCLNPDHIISGDECRFWAKVQKIGHNGCWMWTACKDRDQYGQFTYRENGVKISDRAHVYSWELHNNSTVPDGMCVCHTCDHPWCVNPDHFFIGTNLDNSRDRQSKGKGAVGEKSPHAKLTDNKVKKIRKMFATGKYTKTHLSDLFGVSITTISFAIRRKTWRHIA